MLFALCRFFIYVRVQHNGDVSIARRSFPFHFRFGMLTGNGKCDWIFRARLILLEILSKRKPEIEWKLGMKTKLLARLFYFPVIRFSVLTGFLNWETLRSPGFIDARDGLITVHCEDEERNLILNEDRMEKDIMIILCHSPRSERKFFISK